MRRVLFAVASAAVLFATPGAGQSYRGWLSSSMHMVELRPVGLDSVALADVVADADGRTLFGGYEVACGGGTMCTGLLPLAVERTVTATQDVGLTFWGLGMQGLSFTTLLRVRAAFGSDVLWPRSDDEFDAMLGYAQLQRGAVRTRVGRQEVRSGLGFSAFDGLDASFDRGRFRLQAYGGRSLARGLREPANEAARGLDDFFVDHGVYLTGGAVTLRNFGSTLTARYHREILADRSGLDAERASFDVSTLLPSMRISASIDYDLSSQKAGKGHLTLSAPLRGGAALVELTARRYVPYFQLSTIWGFFEPVSYSEVLARAGWSGSAKFGVWLAGGVRSYGDTGTPVVLSPLEDTGWRVDAGTRWEPTELWSVDARYQIDWLPGAFLSSADASIRYGVSERLGVGLSLSTFQQIEEFRLGDGRAFGAGGSVDFGINERMDLFGGFSVTRHRDGGSVFTSPWHQNRGWSGFRWAVGSDPGLANQRGRR